MRNNNPALILCLFSLFSNQANSAESPDLPGLSEMDGLQTSIATRTRLNIDYAPGTVNILFGEDLLSKGARIVWEALALVPGFEPAIDETGTRQILVRGVGRTYSSGNIKILLNDIGQNSELLSLANPVLNMPLEQVERIEVIRGPGSAIYGQSAYVGVVNVITRKQGQRVFAALGERGAAAGGGVFSFVDPARQLDLSLNLAGWKREGGGLRAGEDAGYAEGFVAESNAPGQANDKRDYRSALFNLNFEQFSLNVQWVEDGAGDHFGINSYLPPNERRIVTRQRHRSVEAKQAFDLSDDLQAEFRLGWADYSRTRDHLFQYPVGVEPDQWIDMTYREQRLNADVDLAWETGRNTWLLGLYFGKRDVSHAESFNSQGQANDNWIDRQRNVSSLTVQDQFRATDAVTLTAGLRHDHYSDVGSSTTPRVAAVWQVAPGQQFKAQYAEAFRAPTFYELLYGDTPPFANHLQPETIATREFGYAIKTASSHAAITVFDSILKHPIVFDESLGYLNHAQDSQSRGVELEAEHWLTSQVKLDGNFSLIRTNDHATGQPIPGAASRLLNLGVAWSPSKDVALDIRLRTVGSRHREQADLRDKLASYSTVDLTARVFNLGYRGLTLRGGIKNLFDHEVKVPSTIDIYATPAPNYRDDMPMSDGRGVWVQATYSFD